jgi:hypothetical protein
MVTRSILTTIIGFLIGWILYLIVKPYITFIFLFGGLGYIIGLLLDTNDRKRQLDAFHPTSILSTHEIFHSDQLPEAVVIYSSINNTTSVLLDYRIEAKPENYRLSVLKNLQDFDFRIIEDTSQTFFSLCIEYPEFNYPSIKNMHSERTKFFYDIEERSNDFRGAVRKLIPGIVINAVQNPDIFGNETKKGDNSYTSPPYPFFTASPKNSSILSPGKKIKGLNSVSTSEENNFELESEASESSPPSQLIKNSNINEEKIMDDLNQASSPNNEEEVGTSENLPDIEINEGFFQRNSRNSPKIDSSTKKSSILTAKQIEESQNNIITYEKNEETVLIPESQSIDPKDEKKYTDRIIDYSSLDNSSSMPMDEVGKGIFNRIDKALTEHRERFSKNKERVPTKDI